jgi:diacylglycerol kinase (ATP)
MQINGPQRILSVINPISGGTAKQNWENAIRDHFRDKPHSLEFFVLDGKSDTSSLRHWIEKIKPDRVLAVGGDGTVSMIAKELTGTSSALAIIPAGSANGMAKELNIPQQPQRALELAETGQIKNADIIRINEKHFCIHLSDIGLNARLIKYFDEGKLRGKIGYAKVILKTLWKQSSMDILIETADKKIETKAFMVVLANASKYGTGAVINPVGDLYDGLFEVVIVRKLAVSELFKMLFRPQPFNPKKIEMLHARSVAISSRKRVHFQIDGEYRGKVETVNAVIMPGALKIVVPDN